MARAMTKTERFRKSKIFGNEQFKRQKHRGKSDKMNTIATGAERCQGNPHFSTLSSDRNCCQNTSLKKTLADSAVPLP